MRSFINGWYLMENPPVSQSLLTFNPPKNSIHGKNGITRNSLSGKTNNNELHGSRFPVSFFSEMHIILPFSVIILLDQRRPGHPVWFRAESERKRLNLCKNGNTKRKSLPKQTHIRTKQKPTTKDPRQLPLLKFSLIIYVIMHIRLSTPISFQIGVIMRKITLKYYSVECNYLKKYNKPRNET